MAKKQKITKKVSIDLSDAQCLAIGKEQAEKELLYAKVEVQKSEQAAEFASRLKKLWGEIQELAGQQKEKKRIEEVEVVEVVDAARKTVKICRADDEHQILETRPMTLNEMAEARQKDFASCQASLPVDGKEKASGESDDGEDGQKIVKLERGRKKKNQDANEEPERPLDA